MRALILLGSVIGALVGIGAALVHSFPELSHHWLGGTPLDTLVSKTKPLYLWRDQRGRWQATDQPPPAGTSFEIKQYPIDANIMPSQDGAER